KGVVDAILIFDPPLSKNLDLLSVIKFVDKLTNAIQFSHNIRSSVFDAALAAMETIRQRRRINTASCSYNAKIKIAEKICFLIVLSFCNLQIHWRKRQDGKREGFLIVFNGAAVSFNLRE